MTTGAAVHSDDFSTLGDGTPVRRWTLEGARGFHTRVCGTPRRAGRPCGLTLVAEVARRGLPGAAGGVGDVHPGRGSRPADRLPRDDGRADRGDLTNHTYGNLAGADSGSALGRELRLAAGRITPVDGESTPTGGYAPVGGTRYDVREPGPLGPGYDTAHVLEGPGGEFASTTVYGFAVR